MTMLVFSKKGRNTDVLLGRNKFYINNTLCCPSPLPALKMTHNGLFRAFQLNKKFKI